MDQQSRWDGQRWMSAGGGWWWNGQAWIATPTQPQQPLLSPDGRWWWNGQSWLPAQAQSTQTVAARFFLNRWVAPALLGCNAIAWALLGLLYLGQSQFRPLASSCFFLAVPNAVASALTLRLTRGFRIAGASVAGLAGLFTWAAIFAGDNPSLGEGLGGLFFLLILVGGFFNLVAMATALTRMHRSA